MKFSLVQEIKIQRLVKIIFSEIEPIFMGAKMQFEPFPKEIQKDLLFQKSGYLRKWNPFLYIKLKIY